MVLAALVRRCGCRGALILAAEQRRAAVTWDGGRHQHCSGARPRAARRRGTTRRCWCRSHTHMKSEPFPEPDDVGDLPLADAERVVRQALAQAEVSHGPDDLRVAGRLVQLGRLLLVIGERGGEQAKAGPPLRRALAIAGAAYGGQDPRLLELLELLARQIMSTSQGPEAEKLRQRALAIAEATYGPDHPEVAVAVGRLAGQYPYDPKHAEPLRRRALRIDEAALGPNHPRVADDLAALASSLQEFDTSHDLGAGEMVFDGKGGHVIRRPAPPPDRSAEVEVLLRRALEVAEAAHGPDHPAVAARLFELAAVLGARGKLAEAEALRRPHPRHSRSARRTQRPVWRAALAGPRAPAGRRGAPRATPRRASRDIRARTVGATPARASCP